MLDVRPERTGWRDLDLNNRHRVWGFDCPAVDVDLVLLEYHTGRACALVEYKKEHAHPQQMTHPSYRAIVDLANRADIPAFFVRYGQAFVWFRVYPMNALATAYVEHDYLDLSECQYVELMYQVRGMACPSDVCGRLHDGPVTPPAAVDSIDWATRQIRASEWRASLNQYPYKKVS